MSDTPQERIMMYNNGRRSYGHVLVGGLGLGLYPQYAVSGAAGEATRITVIESSSVVRAIVEPTLEAVLDVPLQVTTGDVEAYLAEPVTARFDTIFLDVWETLDAVHLPRINRLRDLALRRLAPDGRVLLWGYRWMVRLFEQACRQVLAVPPGKRTAWLTSQAEASPAALTLLEPVVDHFRGREIKDWDMILAWCRHYAAQVTS
jgi:spermidine synthase